MKAERDLLQRRQQRLQLHTLILFVLSYCCIIHFATESSHNKKTTASNAPNIAPEITFTHQHKEKGGGDTRIETEILGFLS